ncbi:MAG: STAS domain-containing protein [Verrucomicrobia bacterium]|nr:STAS domain-containing protein [Verrucomicrobiota bacterium]
MSDEQANLRVGVGDQAVYIRIDGRANMHASVNFKDVVQLLRDKGHRRFVLDLTGCKLMDSTFLGVLARLGIDAASPASKTHDVSFELLNPNEHIQTLLDTLGVRQYFRVLQGQADARQQSTPMTAVDNPSPPADAATLARLSLDAHNTLIQMNARNAAKFQDVTEYLAAELKKLNPNTPDARNAAGARPPPDKPPAAQPPQDPPKVDEGG